MIDSKNSQAIRTIFYIIVSIGIGISAILLFIVLNNPAALGVTNAGNDEFARRIQSACDTGVKVEQCRTNGDYYFDRAAYAYDGVENLYTQDGRLIETTGGWGIYEQGPAYTEKERRIVGCEPEETKVICDSTNLF